MYQMRRISGNALVIAVLALAVFMPFAGAQAKDRILHSFAGGNSDGANPMAGLVIDNAGNLFGTTYYGGPNNGGTIFEVARGGVESVLYAFTGGNDGGGPQDKLIMDAKGRLYGTTVFGGKSEPGGAGAGTVFVLKFLKALKEWVDTAIWIFGGEPDGGTPYAGVAMGGRGNHDPGAATANLYGTTYYGGVYNYGAVFKVTTKGKEAVLYSFTGGSDGSGPGAGVIIDAKGNLYGTTESGGASGYGTVFKITPKGKETVLHSFTIAGGDGGYPYGDLIMDAAANLYGTTGGGGVNYDGTVFKMTPAGKETVLYSFGGGGDGNIPKAGLIMDGQGNLYGTTYYGGSDANGGYGYGTVFKLTPKGAETVLHAFASGSDGAFPQATLVIDKKGSLYGTTGQGGASNDGTVFEVRN